MADDETTTSLCECLPGEACSSCTESPLKVKKTTKEYVRFHIPGCRAFVDGKCDKDCIDAWWESQRG